MTLPSHSHTSDPYFFFLKELQKWKWREDWGKEGPETGPKWDPPQRKIPLSDRITEAMEHSQKGTYHDCLPERLNKQLKESDADICTQPK
jgi:hypothetical protein